MIEAFTTASGTLTPVDIGPGAGAEIFQLHTPGLGDNTYALRSGRRSSLSTRSVTSTGSR